MSNTSIKTFKLGFAPDSPDTLFRFMTKKRGYKSQILEKAGLCVQRGGNSYDRFRARIIFPLSDHYGNILGFSGRVVKDGGDIAKYINSPDTLVYKKGQNLYGLAQTKQFVKVKGYAVVVEGELDLISSFKTDIKNVVAIKGSAFTPEQAELIGRFTKDVRLALDSDFAGDQAARRGIDVLKKQGIDIKVATTNYKDPDEAAKANPEEWAQSVENAQGVYDFLIDSTFAKYDSKTTEGKEKISREVSPILESIEDEIIRAHCAKIIAERLGVGETAVLAQAAKYTNPQTAPQSQSKQNPESKDRRQILEERLLSLEFQTNPQEIKENGVLDLFKNPKAKRLIEEFQKLLEEEFNPQEFAEKLPPDISAFFAEIMLKEEDETDSQKEIQTLINEIKELNAREKIKEITQKLAKKEKEGDQEAVKTLSKELDTAAESLNELES